MQRRWVSCLLLRRPLPFVARSQSFENHVEGADVRSGRWSLLEDLRVEKEEEEEEGVGVVLPSGCLPHSQLLSFRHPSPTTFFFPATPILTLVGSFPPVAALCPPPLPWFVLLLLLLPPV